MDWTIFEQLLIGALLVFFLLRESGREQLTTAIGKFFEICVSKRFITLMIATWFVYAKVKIDPNWLILAGFYIGVDTMQNNGLFGAFADYVKNKKIK